MAEKEKGKADDKVDDEEIEDTPDEDLDDEERGRRSYEHDSCEGRQCLLRYALRDSCFRMEKVFAEGKNFLFGLL
jgi:hypothetical protein